MTTYGELLDQAIDALDAATVAIGAAPPSGLDDQVHIAVARAQLYRNLHQQVVLVGAAPISLLANELAHATARTGNLADGIVLTAPSSPVAVAVARAAAVAEAATAILASHLAPPAPTILALPPAPAAAALREAGHGRPAALRRIGDVVTAATRLDHRLGVWLAQHTIVAAAISDADRTTTSRLPQAAARTARAKQPSPLDTLQANTALEVPHRQRSIDDFGSAFAALDTARGWLLDHRDHHTAIDLTTLSGVGLSLSHQVSFALRLAGHPLPKDAVAHLTHLWRRAGRLLGQLRDVRNIDTSPEIKTLLQVERWLRGLTRHEHGWRLPEDLVRTDADADTWHSLAIQLAARLPDLATLLDYGSNAAISRNALAQLWWPGPREVHGVWVNHPLWQRATITRGPGKNLVETTRLLRVPSEWPAIATSTRPSPGLQEVLDRQPPGRQGQRPTYRNTFEAGRRAEAITSDVRNLRRRVRAATSATHDVPVAAAPSTAIAEHATDIARADSPRLNEPDLAP
ncbi:hypothetical protein GCM10022255_069550 [Dactylosporangium darangshiense]|uniref:Uncharacterized protein n=1 Tax=Dactylosporangium darangshiense TaxID=579108 RepID=A0ABP8DHX3_9ACTN